MNEITAHETIDDSILMAKAYAKGMGALELLDEAEATINERRGLVAERGGNEIPDYSRKIRDTVSALFISTACESPAEFDLAARSFESGWMEFLRKIDAARQD